MAKKAKQLSHDEKIFKLILLSTGDLTAVISTSSGDTARRSPKSVLTLLW